MTLQEKVVIFGAGKAGGNFIHHQQQYEIVAVIDNDEKKVGQYLNGIKIHSPAQLQSLEYEKVIITSMYYKSIHSQLVNDLNIDSNKILAANKAMLKEVLNPFEDEQTSLYALDILKDLTSTFKSFHLNYFLDFGTLLGMIRDQALIKWDDDIDISCYSYDFEKVLVAVESFILKTNNEYQTWEYAIVYNDDKVSNITLLFDNKFSKPLKFSIDIWLIYFEEDRAIQLMNKCGKKFFDGCDKIIINNFEYAIPKFVDEYLTLLYGNWQVPEKNYSFADYPNAF